jgi:hypothetical protein
MPRFEYEALDATGVQIAATIEAPDAPTAIARLRERGLHPVKIAEAGTAPPAAKPPPARPAAARPRGGATGGIFGQIASAVREASAQAERHIGRPSLEEQMAGPVTCGWCHTTYPERPDTTNCRNCGGTLPLPSGPDRGPQPPPPPRTLPKIFLFDLFVRRNYGGWIGIPFMAFPLVILTVVLLAENGPSGGEFAGLFFFLSIFFVVGGLISFFGFRQAFRRKKALSQGVARPGFIDIVTRDRTTSVNDEHPYLVKYSFEVDGTPQEGSKSTFNQQVLAHYPGEPIWVVAVPGQPSCNAIWPPVA